MPAGAPVFFANAAAFRRWLARHHATKQELLVGFYKRGSGRANMTWAESVAQALCFGWIDGVRRRVDDDSYTIRFTPRKARSTWSAVNIRTMQQLIADGRAERAGIAAFEARTDDNSSVYSYEQREAPVFDADAQRRFQEHRAAWEFFQQQAPWYRRTATHYVVSARRPETREKRLALLIECSADGRRLPQLTPGKARKD